MKTKSLLIAAATLAVGIISTQAQVYSQNIVGYVNLTSISGGATPLSTSLDMIDSNGNTNSATNILVNVFDVGIGNGPLDNSQLIIWNGTKFQTYYFDANPDDAAALSQTFTGITDVNGNFVTPPTLGVGKGYYLLYSQVSGFPSVRTNMYVGSVRGATDFGVSNNIVIPPSPLVSFTASGIPVGGGVLTGLGLTNLLATGALDSCNIQVPKIIGGTAHGYTTYYFDSNPQDAIDQSQAYTGMTDVNGSFLPEPVIPTGGSFIFVNGSGTTLTWNQKVVF